jgi:hypothetical protein
VAGALRPVVLLMALAAALFLVDAWLDGVYPGGPRWTWAAYQGLGWTSYLFALVSAAVAVLIARGSERSLAMGVALAGFFVIERPLSAFALGAKPAPPVAVHLLTAGVELAILIGAIRVLRLGRSYGPEEIEAALSVQQGRVHREPAVLEEQPPRALPESLGAVLATLTLLLAAVFVATGIVAGFGPWGGRRWGFAGEESGWLVYVFAAVLILVTDIAVHGHWLAMRILLVLALLYGLERAFTPFALRLADPVAIALHGLGAAIAFALAIVTMLAIRTRQGPPPAHVGGGP